MPLRADLLKGKRIAVSGELDEEVSHALVDRGAGLEVLGDDELPAEEERVGEWARARAPLDAHVHGAGSAFGSGGQSGLLGALDGAWAAVREVAVGALIGSEAPAKIVLLGPRPDAGPLAEAARAGLENLARTLSVEWARYGVTAVMLAPGRGAQAADIGTAVAFLVSEAGGYLSGCRLELGSVG
jgi:NAD(P)-dependent dehydrogenase (short-subunit alcohol dehydrogenase family)